MNIVEEYRNTENKLEFFQSKDLNEQVEIIKNISHEELAEIIKELSFGNIIRIIREVDTEKKKEILSVTPEETLKAIYKASSTKEQQELIELIEKLQADHLKNVDNYNQAISNSSESITNNYQNIATSQINIMNAKENQKITQSKLKDIEKNKKKIEKFRKRLEKRAGKLASKSYVGLFKKRNLKKLQNLQSELKEVNANLDKLNQETKTLTSNIAEYQNTQREEKENIRKAKEEIEQAKKSLLEASQKAQKERKAIAKLDKESINIFGRKIHNKNVHLRGHYLTTMKQEEVKRLKKATEKQAKAEQEKQTQQQKVNQQTENKPQRQESQEIERAEGEIVERTDIKNNQSNTSRESVERLMVVSPMLQRIGVVPQSSNAQFVSNNNEALVGQPIDIITQRDLLILIMFANELTKMYINGYIDAQKNQQGMQETAGNTRTLSRGLVNITTLILTLSVIAIILGILLILKL